MSINDNRAGLTRKSASAPELLCKQQGDFYIINLCVAPKRDAQVLSFPESAVAAGRIYSFGSVSGGNVFTVGSYGSVTVRSECPARIISIIFGEENR